MIRVITVFILIMSQQLSAKHQKMNLQKALDLKLVKAEAKSLGGYQGFCVKMNLKNLTSDSLTVIVEAGRRLNSLDDKNQDILVTQQEIIAMKKLEDRSFNVKGYCCQANNHSPFAGAKYDVNKLADSNLVDLARFLSSSKFETNIEQQAIWAVSDKKPSANIASTNDSLLLPLKQLVANLKGEKLPWYSMITKTILYAGGDMKTYPLYLRGKLNYSNDKEDYVSLYVFDEKGLPVCEIKSQWLMPCVNKDYNLNIPVKGLVKGKYTIELKTPEKQLAKQEFEI
ncbi:MAG: hypothetical protein H0W73_00210 [Bacteroidetes bacterium]|nr:hypothetical protein [Bacteroidota bacterium]